MNIEALTLNSSESLVADCAAILRSVGKGVYTSRYLRAMTVGGMVLYALHKKDILGVLVVEQWKPTDTVDINAWLPRERHLVSDPPSLYISDAATLIEHRRQGVATALVKDALKNCQFLVGEGNYVPFPRALTYCRIPPGGELTGTSYGLLTAVNFFELETVPLCYRHNDYWQCPDCREGCECDGVLMMRKRDGEW